jgi:DNA-binding NarL/FixJ family response regulator
MTKIVKQTELETPTIVIADDHEIYRRGLKAFLEHEGMSVVASVATGNQAVDDTIKLRPDILLLDLVMPDLDGFAVLTLVKYLVPETRVIILTALGDQSLIKRAGELGAEGYFSKGVENDYLIQTIRGIGAGNRSSVFTRSIPAPTVPKEFPPPSSKNKEKSSKGQNLTKKEILILSLVSMGIDNQEIGERVSITQNTLKTHLRKIYSKLSVSDRSQAVIWALRNGF